MIFHGENIFVCKSKFENCFYYLTKYASMYKIFSPEYFYYIATYMKISDMKKTNLRYSLLRHCGVI